MALPNVASPRGFSLLRSGGKAEPRRAIRQVLGGRATDLMIGDAYELDAAGNATRATAANANVRGIVEAPEVRPIAATPQDSASQDYIPAADAGSIIGIEDDDAEFLVQIDDTVNPNFVGADCVLADAPGDIPLRQSRQSVALGAGPFTLMELYQSPADNAPGPNALVVVRVKRTFQQI